MRLQVAVLKADTFANWLAGQKVSPGPADLKPHFHVLVLLASLLLSLEVCDFLPRAANTSW